MSAAKPGLLAELDGFLASWREDLRRLRDWRNLLDLDGALAIAGDLAERDRLAVAAAYRSEQADLEASRLLREALADGKVTAGEIPMLQLALRHVNRSAEADHKLGEVLV